MYMPLFGHLDRLPIRLWDESRLAINAFEMYEDGDWIVTHFNGAPDMWNTKPPLMIWAQVICMHVIGVGELAVRLPSAISGFLTCIVLLLLSLRYLKSFWFGFICIMVLITTHGYLNFHSTRTGDYDAMLALFTTLGCVLFFIYCENPIPKTLYAFFCTVALAILCKGIAGLMFIPGIVAYAFIRKQLIPLLKNKHFYLGLLSFLILASGYYLLREAYNPGFLNAVYENELGGRYLKVNEGHAEDFWFYLNNLVQFQMPFWYWLIPFGWAIGFASKNRTQRSLSQFSMCMALTYFLVISISQTKLEWYDVPIYPFLSIAVAQALHFPIEWVRCNTWLNASLRINLLPLALLFLICINPYRKIWDQTYMPKVYPWEKDFYEIGFYLQQAARRNLPLKDCNIYFPGYNAHHDFYLKILKQQGSNVKIADPAMLQVGDQIILGENETKNYLADHYHYDVIEDHGVVVRYEVLGVKNEELRVKYEGQ